MSYKEKLKADNYLKTVIGKITCLHWRIKPLWNISLLYIVYSGSSLSVPLTYLFLHQNFTVLTSIEIFSFVIRLIYIHYIFSPELKKYCCQCIILEDPEKSYIASQKQELYLSN